MTDYTRGKWRCYKLPEGWRIESVEWRIGQQIAFSIPNEANARLMASAPDMYEALKKIASCESHAIGDVVDIAQKALMPKDIIISRIKQILAKTKGLKKEG